jgi:hypothetical protein
VSREALRLHVNWKLNKAVADVLKVLGIRGEFVLSGTGNIALVGNPDFTWVQGLDITHPKLIVRISHHSHPVITVDWCNFVIVTRR